MTTVYLVRHGRTAWNNEGVFRGRKDIPLDEVGKREACLVGARLRGEGVVAVYSSPLARAMETAAAVAQHHGIGVTVAEGLVDLDFGAWEGLTVAQVMERYPDLYRLWLSAPHEVVFPGGESLAAVRRRATEALASIMAQNHDGALVLVTHRVVLKVLICALLGLEDSHFWGIAQDTTALNAFHYREGRWVCALLNDTCHLKGGVGGRVDF